MAKAEAEKREIWSILTDPEGGETIVNEAESTVRGIVYSTINFCHWPVSPVKVLVNIGISPL